MQDRASLLGEMLQSQDPKPVIRLHLSEIDDAFMSVLAANIAQAQEERPEAAQRLLTIRNSIVEVLQESAPPELRFITRLMEAEYPDETRRMLSNSQSMVTPQVLGMMDALVAEFEQRDDKEASEKLRGILAQAKLMG
jgi:hypothetical protein